MLLALAALAYLLFFNNLGHLLPGFSASELQSHNQAMSLQAIINNPIDAPFKLAVLLAAKLGYHGLLAARVVAASYGVLACLVFFMVVRGWFTYRVTFLATVMFATSSGFLHVARLGTPLVLQMSILLLIGILDWYRRTNHHLWVSYLAVSLFALLWYIPGMVWFELLAIVLLRTGIVQALKRGHWLHKVAWAMLFGAFLTPLIHAALKSPSLLKTAAGLPAHFTSVIHMADNLATAFLSISIRSNGSPELWLGHAPLLDVAEGVLLLLGVYFFAKRLRSIRSIGFFVAVAITLLLIGLGGPVAISALVPLLYIAIAGGLQVLVKRWQVVFPRNPVAQLAGITLVFIVVSFSVLYQVRAYYVAWPHNDATRQIFRRHLP